MVGALHMNSINGFRGPCKNIGACVCQDMSNYSTPPVSSLCHYQLHLAHQHVDLRLYFHITGSGDVSKDEFVKFWASLLA